MVIEYDSANQRKNLPLLFVGRPGDVTQPSGGQHKDDVHRQTSTHQRCQIASDQPENQIQQKYQEDEGRKDQAGQTQCFWHYPSSGGYSRKLCGSD